MEEVGLVLLCSTGIGLMHMGSNGPNSLDLPGPLAAFFLAPDASSAREGPLLSTGVKPDEHMVYEEPATTRQAIVKLEC